MARRRRRKQVHRSRASHPRRFALCAGLILAAGFPATAIGLLRWVPAPTSAFMLAAPCSSVDYEWLPADAIPDHVALAFLAAEDQRFWDHGGFDVEAIREALDARAEGAPLRGASTISQQVAKNLFLWEGRSWLRKGLEAYLTLLLERLTPKRRILELYLNLAQLGPCTFGVQAASLEYFGRSAEVLGRRDGALLASVLPNPIERRADRPSELVRKKAELLLIQMDQLGLARTRREF